MSIELNWETLTGGGDGKALAETIKEFIHERFQQVSFPKLIRSVAVHSFDFGNIAPEIVLKDICDPLPDFYDLEDESGQGDESSKQEDIPNVGESDYASRHPRHRGDGRRPLETEFLDHASSPTLARGAILGGNPNFAYFHIPAFSGTTTPLAAVAGAHFQNGPQTPGSHHHHSESFDSISPPPTLTPPSRPTSRDPSYFDSRRASAILEGSGDQTLRTEPEEHERNPEDLQVVFQISYSGDVRLSMTAEVFLDYPMPSFVGIPLKLNITGITFNGVGILAHIRNRAHVCFLNPEDAEALVGGEHGTESPDGTDSPQQSMKVGALLEEIKIESEMGETGEGNQVLKNVGKIEKFILEQVQHIFEEEFVYPSFWTFLV